MPTLAITKVFFHAESQSFCVEFADFTRTRFASLTTLAQQCESWEWAALQVAVKAPDRWIEV